MISIMKGSREYTPNDAREGNEVRDWRAGHINGQEPELDLCHPGLLIRFFVGLIFQILGLSKSANRLHHYKYSTFISLQLIEPT